MREYIKTINFSTLRSKIILVILLSILIMIMVWLVVGYINKPGIKNYKLRRK